MDWLSTGNHNKEVTSNFILENVTEKVSTPANDKKTLPYLIK